MIIDKVRSSALLISGIQFMLDDNKPLNLLKSPLVLELYAFIKLKPKLPRIVGRAMLEKSYNDAWTPTVHVPLVFLRW